MASPKKSVLFVCLGNICRSPIAEAIFAHMVKEKGLSDQWKIESAGTHGHEAGKSADHRGQRMMDGKGILMKHIARQVTKDDFHNFDTIFGMDGENIRNLKKVQPKDGTAVLKMLGEYDPEKELVIEDPYFGGDEGFVTVFDQCTRCCKAFLEEKSK